MLFVLCIALAIAFMNGTNDVSKGIATLVGSGVTNYKRAILWGTLWTGIGGLAGAYLAGAMLETFGKGLLQRGTAPSFAAAAATILGATLWIAFASKTGLPVSTTHAIVGSLVGVAATAYGPGAVVWHSLQTKIALPLLLSPILSLILTFLTARFARWSGVFSDTAANCVCVEMRPALHAVAAGAELESGVHAFQDTSLRVETGPTERCAVEHPTGARITLDHLHWLTSGGTSFARGLNDAPKMVAIVLAAAALTGETPNLKLVAFVVITLGMMAGSLMGGRRVTQVLAEKVTRMNHREGFLANLITALLVGSGAGFGLPMSTTHVSSGAIFGIGAEAKDGRVHWKIVWQIVGAWVITLPSAALLGILTYLLFRRIF
jgi:PiT family inorganic phosphate transporter